MLMRDSAFSEACTHRNQNHLVRAARTHQPCACVRYQMKSNIHTQTLVHWQARSILDAHRVMRGLATWHAVSEEMIVRAKLLLLLPPLLCGSRFPGYTHARLHDHAHVCYDARCYAEI